jgi:hypothetical protein
MAIEAMSTCSSPSRTTMTGMTRTHDESGDCQKSIYCEPPPALEWLRTELERVQRIQHASALVAAIPEQNESEQFEAPDGTCFRGEGRVLHSCSRL